MVLHRITGKVPNCSDNILARNRRVSNITGSLWVLGPDTNTLAPLLQHSVLSPAQGTVDQSWHLTGVRRATVVPCGSNVQEIAQVVKEREVILWVSYLDAALHPPGPAAAQPALQRSQWRSPGSFTLRRTSKNNSKNNSPEGVHKRKKSNPKGGGWKRSDRDEKHVEKMPEGWCNHPLSKHPVTRDDLSRRWAAGLPLLTKPIWVKYLWSHLQLGNSFLARFSTQNLNHTKTESPSI